MRVRNGDEAYARYLRGMDASMRVKVALTAAHVLGGGRAADMGMGSGGTSAALAGLYPGLDVVGVDLDPSLVERARRTHVLPNLSFVVGDIACPPLPSASFDAIFDSSVLHHVTSFGGYDHGAAARALAAQVALLREHGVLIVRDFLTPDGAEREVELDLPANDATEGESTAALLERFAREFRSLSSAPGFPLAQLDGAPVGWRRYRLALRHAVEFALRKDYRADWQAEVQEEYTFATLSELVALSRRLGLRVLTAQPLRNPWIIRNRFDGKLVLRDGSTEMDPIATNFLLVAQKVAAGSSVSFSDEGPAPSSGFLELVHHEHIASKSPRDLVRRPGVTIDVIPYFSAEDGAVQVVFRSAMPRPILKTTLVPPAPCGGHAPEFLAEALHARMTDRPLAETVEGVLQLLGLGEDAVRRIEPGTTLYPSPGGIQEEVRSVFVELAPLVAEDVGAVGTPFSSSGRIQSASGLGLLRAAMVGGLTDARLEVNVRSLLARRGVELGPWLGDVAPLGDAIDVEPSSLAPLLAASRRAFRRAQRGAGFLTLAARRFVERDADGASCAEAVFDVVLPATLSAYTVAILPLGRVGDVVVAGIDDDDLPAAQAFVGSSSLLVAPAFRSTHEAARSLRALVAFAKERLKTFHGLSVRELFEVGGRYAPSPGMTPELVYPFAAWVDVVRRVPTLHWVPLAELNRNADLLLDGHLRVLVTRTAHAYGVV